MVKASVITQFLNAGKNLTPLSLIKPKVPIEKDWTNKNIETRVLMSHKGNIGWVLGKGDLIIDVDIRNGGLESFNKILQHLVENNSYEQEIDLPPMVETPSGGFHIYLKLSKEQQKVKLKKQLNKLYKGIDFLSQGAQCVIPTSVVDDKRYEWADGFGDKFLQLDAPQVLVDLLSQDGAKTFSIDNVPARIYPKESEEVVKGMLGELDASMPYPNWVTVGMSLHSWDSDKGLVLWDEWSAKSDKYKPGECAKKWETFTQGKGISIATLKSMTSSWRRKVYFDSSDTIQELIEAIESVVDVNKFLTDIFPMISNANIPSVDKSTLVPIIQKHMMNIANRKYTKKEILELIIPPKDHPTPEWLKQWIYVKSEGEYYDLATGLFNDKTQFSSACAPYSAVEGFSNVTAYLGKRGGLPSVNKIVYLPDNPNLLVQDEYEPALNIFRRDKLPQPDAEFTKEGGKAIEILSQHIDYLIGNEKDGEIFRQWLAHQIQKPGVLIRWAPLIQGTQGCGKSVFSKLLKKWLGNKNVGNLTLTTLSSGFSSWCFGRLVNVIEEIRISGDNRYRITDQLKPYITNTYVERHPKGIDPYDVLNVTNYIAFTNHRDALPIAKDDRRWWVVISPLQDEEDVERITGQEKNAYIKQLLYAVETQAEQLHKWLADYTISDEFYEYLEAPHTEGKDIMRDQEEEKRGYDDLLDEIIEEGGKFWDETIICANPLFREYANRKGDLITSFNGDETMLPAEYKGRQQNTLLSERGYMLTHKRYWVKQADGTRKRENVWTKELPKISNSEVERRLTNCLESSIDKNVDADVPF